MEELLKGKKVLVTGGTGSIGSEIVRQLLKYEPAQIRVFDSSEQKLFDMGLRLESKKNIRFLVGDVRERSRVSLATEGIDFVFHAAALKHVASCEYNPFEAIKTNLYGTQNVINCALKNKVSTVINISTDKAANPVGTMGATKLLAERLCAATYQYTAHLPTRITCVRFGNVLNSSGSVIPIFKEQIEAGGPVTITHKDMTRFMMPIPRAVELVFRACKYANVSELLVLKMPALKIVDLAEVMIAASSKNVDVRHCGVRPGERIYEPLMTVEEAMRAYETDDMFVIPRDGHSMHFEDNPEYSRAKVQEYSTKTTRLLSKEEIHSLLARSGILPEV